MQTSPRSLAWTVAEVAAGIAAVGVLAHEASWNGAAWVSVAAAIVISGSALARSAVSHLIAFAWVPPVVVLLFDAPEGVAAVAAGGASVIATGGALLPAERFARWQAVLLVVVWTVALRIVPFAGIPLAEIVVVGAGSAALCLVLSRGATPGAGPVAIGILASALALPAPAEAALMPALLAAFVAAANARRMLLSVLACVAALIAGKWILPVVALAFLPWVKSPLRGSEWVLPVWWSPGAAARGLLVLAATGPLWVRARSASGILATALALGALLIDRPWISAVWLLGSLVTLVHGSDDAGDRRPLAAITLLIAAGIGWSGAIPGVFPLPGSLLVTAAVAVVLVAVTARPAAAGLLATLALGAFTLTTIHQPLVSRTALEVELTEAEPILLELEPDAKLTAVRMSGANISALRPDTPVATIDSAADAEGYRRIVTAGEVGDWGGFRDEHLFTTRTRAMARPGLLEGVGREAFVRGDGLIPLAAGASPAVVRIRRVPGLDGDVVLVVEAMESQP